MSARTLAPGTTRAPLTPREQALQTLADEEAADALLRLVTEAASEGKATVRLELDQAYTIAKRLWQMAQQTRDALTAMHQT